MSAHTAHAHRPRVALGMSGGVDSSLCAHLLLEQGYDVTGIYLECWTTPGCRTHQDRKDALAVALELGIPFQVLDFKQAYKQEVIEDFFREYRAGRTPNPDVLCNREIKFGLFYDWAMKQGFDSVATGHYARISKLEGAQVLTIPADVRKDQTYFLYLLRQEQLQNTLFPLANLTKQEVRSQAHARNLLVADKKDSVGICFIGDINVHDFLQERLGENPGDVVDADGNVIGSHRGLWFYTVGQRHGFTVHTKTVLQRSDGTMIDRQNIPPFYVIAKKPQQNQLVVGFGVETLQSTFTVPQLHWMYPDLSVEGSELTRRNVLVPQQLNCHVRIRHTGQLLPCRIERSKDTYTVTLSEAVQGIAQGQSAVFYLESSLAVSPICLGGGVIES